MISRRIFWSIIAALYAMFLLFPEPVWRNPYDIDPNIIYSYLAIPALVLVGHLIDRNLSFVSVLVSLALVTAVKFQVTYATGIVMWMAFDPPERAPVVTPAPTRAPPRAPTVRPPPTVIDPRDTGGVDVLVTRDQRPLPGALVFVDRGVEGLVFALPERGSSLRHQGDGYAPAAVVVRQDQLLSIASESTSMHALVAETFDGQRIFNRPLVPTGTLQTTFHHDHGLVRLRCAVHGDAEPTATLVIVDHPFAGITDARGRVTLSGVPAGAVSLKAYHPSVGVIDHAVQVRPGASRAAATIAGLIDNAPEVAP